MGNYPGLLTAHQGQMIVLAGDDAEVTNMKLVGGTYTAGGVAVGNTARNRVVGVYSSGGGTSQGQLWTASRSLTSLGNVVEYSGHGIQMWATDGGTVTGNIVRGVLEGGIWTADTANMQITGNFVANCGDVGLDIEGGINNSITGNAAYCCKNGELAYFNNGTGSGRVPFNNTISGNVAWRSQTYLHGPSQVVTATDATFAALTIYSITNGQQNVTFKGNTLWANGRNTLFTNDLGAAFCGIEISNNTFTSDTLLHNVQRATGIKVVDNKFRGLGATVAAAQNIFKNCSGGLWDLNSYEYDTPKNSTPALYYLTDTAIPVGPTISRNKFRNCNTLAFKHDPYVSGVPAIVSGNEFSEGFVSNGGMESTANGYPLYRGQRMLYRFENPAGTTTAFDCASVTSLGGGLTTMTGTLQCWMGGALGSTYSVVRPPGSAVYSRDSSGAGSGIGASASRYATFAGSVITVTGPANGPTGYLSAELMSYA